MSLRERTATQRKGPPNCVVKGTQMSNERGEYEKRMSSTNDPALKQSGCRDPSRTP